MIDYKKEGIVHYNKEYKESLNSSLIESLKKEDLHELLKCMKLIKNNKSNILGDKIDDMILYNKTNFYEKITSSLMSLPTINTGIIGLVMGVVSLGYSSSEIIRLFYLIKSNLKNEIRYESLANNNTTEELLNDLTINELYSLRNMINNKKRVYTK